MNQRATEFFGPDLGRGPFASQRIETAVIQIATALAQIRAPLTRSDSDLMDHADFIRDLADRLAPDFAAAVSFTVAPESGNNVQTSIRTAIGVYSLLDCWLADNSGGAESGTAPNSVTWNSGTVLETITANKRYLVITTSTGILDVTVNYPGVKNWHWAVTRLGRIYYSSTLAFT